MKFKVGDKVVRTASCSDDYTVKQGGEYIIYKVDDELNNIYLEGVVDSNGQPDWFNPNNFKLVEAVSEGKQMSKFNKGDKVRCVESNHALGVNVGGVYTIKDPQHHEGYIDKGWHVTLEEVISTPSENVLELYEEDVVKDTSKQTPFEKEGWTENSIFKVIGNSCSHQFDIGSLVVLHEDDESKQPCFKPQEFHGKKANNFKDCWYAFFKDLEYVGEIGDDDMVKEDKDYRSMSPTTLIPISIDGNDFEVKLGSLVLARYIIGEANGSYIDSLYCALDVIDKEDQIMYFESQNTIDCSDYEKDLFSKYFKDKAKESKKFDIKAQIESLQEQLKALD